MKLEDAREIQADPATVWSAILDPEILKTCIPGCEELLHYAVEAKVGGKLAQLGSRIIDGFAKKLADQFFERLQTGLESPDGSEPEQESAKDEPKKGWIARLRG